jgi:hypothetical protein
LVHLYQTSSLLAGHLPNILKLNISNCACIYFNVYFKHYNKNGLVSYKTFCIFT